MDIEIWNLFNNINNSFLNKIEKGKHDKINEKNNTFSDCTNYSAIDESMDDSVNEHSNHNKNNDKIIINDKKNCIHCNKKDFFI